jgi:copper chaperone
MASEKETLIMTTYTVPDMDCGGCVASITRAVQKLDGGATIKADLDTKRVEVTSRLNPEAIRSAIEDAGFTPA